MRLLSRTIFREILLNAMLGITLFGSVLYLPLATNLFAVLVNSSGPPRTVAYLFALVLPQALPPAIPLGVLAGVLLTLSRMSADGEITAMRAAGVSGRRVIPPILLFGFLGMLAAATASLWLTPWSIYERYRVLNQLIATQLTANVQARVFAEQFPDQILYVGDVPPAAPGAVVRWRNVFLADVTPPDRRGPGDAEHGDDPWVVLAPEALAVPDNANNRIQLSLKNSSTYGLGKDAKYDINSVAQKEQSLQAQRPGEKNPSRPTMEMDTGPLYKLAYRNRAEDKARILEARVELQQRLALPFACILLALVGVPLGITSRRGGKSSAVVLTVTLAFVYYIGMASLSKIARQGSLPAEIAGWIPNLAFALLGLAMLARLESPGDRDYWGRFVTFLRAAGRSPRKRVLGRLQGRSWTPRFSLLAQIVDTYLLSGFVFYFVLWLISFVLMYHVFTFFDILGDAIKHNVAMPRMLTYHFFLTARLVYWFAPVAVLAAVLVVFGVLGKNNEVTAFKACGVSAYRLAAPILVAGALLSAALFAFDYRWVPAADRRQEEIYAEIKGKAAQTFARADRRWIYGLHNRIFYFKYFDPEQKVMLGVNVYEIDAAHFRLTKQISAERARWSPELDKWVFENGWSREMADHVDNYDPFAGSTRTFPELEEKPDYFDIDKGVKPSLQMNYRELQAEIADLKQSGFDTVALQVQLQKKFSLPLFALILAIVAVPFAFQSGYRGAMAGVGISFGIFIAYWAADKWSEQLGVSNLLTPAVAAWSPDVIFSLFGLYFLARMRT
jgi:lipopolysaccharide export system permease protein